jgi:hypothetical protein
MSESTANLPHTRVSTRLPCLRTMGDCGVDPRDWYSKRMRLTKRETAILHKVLAQVTPERCRCYVNAQRASLYSEGKMLYHEGTFGGRLAHAWNSINGKIIDISSRNAIVVSQNAYYLFVSHGTYTSEEVVRNSVFKNHGVWNWIGEPIGAVLKPVDECGGGRVKFRRDAEGKAPQRKPASGIRIASHSDSGGTQRVRQIKKRS